MSFEKPPEHAPCYLCQTQCRGYLLTEEEWQYECSNHNELHVDWRCTKQPNRIWLFHEIAITLRGHFRLRWLIYKNLYFYLYEWTTGNTNFHHWKVVNSNPDGKFVAAKFKPEEILAKSNKQLSSFFQMYRIFL